MEHHTATDAFRMAAFFEGGGDEPNPLPHDPYRYFLLRLIAQALTDVRLGPPDSRDVLDWLGWFFGAECKCCHSPDENGECYHMTFAEAAEHLGLTRDEALLLLADRLQCGEPCQLALY